MISALFVLGPRFRKGTFHDFGLFRARSLLPEGDLPRFRHYSWKVPCFSKDLPR